MKKFSKLLPNSTRNWILSGVGLLALVVFSGFIIMETTKAEVVITDNGTDQTLKTHADTVQELLAEAGIAYSEHDELSHNIDTPIEDGMTITYDTASQLTVVIDDEKEDYYTTADTISEFLEKAGISVGKHDDTSHDGQADVSDGMTYTLDKAFKVTINDGGEKNDVWTTGGTVGELLEDNEISLDDDADKLEPAKDKKVKEDRPVTITRVDKETDKVEETIDFEVEERKDDSLEKGKEKVISEGQKGIVVKTYEITTENGEEVDRELTDETTKQESENRIVALGTKEKEPEKNLTTLSADSNSDDDDNKDSNNDGDGNVMHMNASAYTVDCLGCNGSGHTATGINLKENPNVVSVDPNVIPLGSRIWVEGYGNAIAGDTGGHIKGNRIDLHFESKSKANSFGRKTVKVKVLD
ncbi:ubiquitin-like domain-containing protein [Lentibacillus salinarum]|uniref:Ubiquitin-like domain-containing protein n=1 Tax=Lentibacillus salinarum TaxID=446820 RepID=A0ABW3ZW12_9BACI